MGLDLLAKYPEHQVMLVSGEKCMQMTNEELNGDAVAVTWVGGDSAIAYTDWTPLFKRKVNYCSDADETGVNAMRKIFDLIEKSGTGVSADV